MTSSDAGGAGGGVGDLGLAAEALAPTLEFGALEVDGFVGAVVVASGLLGGWGARLAST